MRIKVIINQQTTYIEFEPTSQVQILTAFKKVMSLADCDAELINRLVFIPPVEEPMRIGETYVIG